MTCGAAFKRETAFAVSRLKVARVRELSFCAVKPRKNLRRIRTFDLKLLGVSAQTHQLKNIMELCFSKATYRRSKRYCHAAAQTRPQRQITLPFLYPKKARLRYHFFGSPVAAHLNRRTKSTPHSLHSKSDGKSALSNNRKLGSPA